MSFTDDRGHEETLSSTATAAVEAVSKQLPELPAGSTVLWSADMTVVDYGAGSVGAGSADLFANQVSADNHEAQWLWSYTPSRQVDLSLLTAIMDTEDLVLHIGGLELLFADALGSFANFTWYGVDVDWEDGQTLPARIARVAQVSEPVAYTPATGAPTISGTAQVGETLTADTSGVADEDGLTNASFSYQWQADGSAIAGATGSTYTLVNEDKGATISVTVSFTDDAGNEESLTSAATAAVEARPNSPATGLPTISGTVQVGETLAADTSGIADEDGLDNATYSYQWQADGTDISGATDSTYTLTFAEADKTIKVRVSFTDDRGNAETLTSAATQAVSATSQQHANSPATGQPVISGTAQVAETLTADTSGIADEDGLEDATFAYQWQADGSDIAGATGSTYALVAADEGKTISVTVSFTDDAGNKESLTSAVTAAVEAKPNSPATGLPTISGTAQVGETLTADTSSIADEDGLENSIFSYQWQADRADIADATGSTYTLVDSDEGKTVSVTVSFTDDVGNEETMTSGATAVVEARPNTPATGAPTISGTARVGETLTADISGISDADGLNNATFSYQWQADGADIAGATRSTYTLVDADEGKTISVTVSFTDDRGHEGSLSSADTDAVTAKPNSPATGLPTISGTAQVGETLTAGTSGISDEDGLTNVSYSYQWQADGADISGATGSTYTLADTDEGKAVSVMVSFTDDRGNEESLTSEPTDAVEALQPDLALGLVVIAASPLGTYPGDTVRISAALQNEGDGVSPATTLRYYQSSDANIDASDTEVGTAYVAELAASESTSGETVEVTAPPTSGTYYYGACVDAVAGESDTSNNCSSSIELVVLAPNSPATGAPTISGTAQLGEILTVDTSGISDANGLTDVSFSYQWLADGAEIAGATGSTYTLVDADEGKSISVTVSFTDDRGNAESLTSTATAAVETRPNTPATGLPTINGTAQVGETLTAYTSGIADADGLGNAVFSYQWQADGADVSGATGSSYTLVDTDEGKAISVRVSFTDDAGNTESLSSAATAAVSAAPAPQTLTAVIENAPSSHDGQNVFTFELRFSEEFPLGYKRLRDHAFQVTGGDVKKAKRLERGSDIGWRLHVRPDSTGTVIIVLPATTDCDAPGAICTGDGRMLSSRLELTVSGP